MMPKQQTNWEANKGERIFKVVDRRIKGSSIAHPDLCCDIIASAEDVRRAGFLVPNTWMASLTRNELRKLAEAINGQIAKLDQEICPGKEE